MSDDLLQSLADSLGIQVPAAPFTDLRVRCGSCNHNPATAVVSLREPEQDGSAEPYLLLRCDLIACRMDVPDGEIVDTAPLTRPLAEQITGDDLSPVSTADRLDGLFPEGKTA